MGYHWTDAYTAEELAARDAKIAREIRAADAQKALAALGELLLDNPELLDIFKQLLNPTTEVFDL